MNDMVNNLFLAGDKFIPAMHLRQPASLDKSAFTYKTCGPFTKNKERIQKFREARD